MAYEASDNKAAFCPTPNYEMTTASVRMSAGLPVGGVQGVSFATEHVLSATHQVKRFFATQKPSCSDSAMVFGYSQSAVIGVYAGAEVHQHGLTAKVLDKLLSFVEEKGISKSTSLQICPKEGLGADYTLGVVITGAANFAVARDTVRNWAGGRCDVGQNGNTWMNTTVRVPPTVSSNSTMTSIPSNATRDQSVESISMSNLSARGECRTTKVESGDGCWAVAKRCGIDQDQLLQYNSRNNFCSTLVPGEKVCCSSGSLPSGIPPANGDGSCQTKEVKGGDSCNSMASKCGIAFNDFLKINTRDNLCLTLQPGQLVCCSEGRLPNRPEIGADGSCAVYTVAKDDGCFSIAAAHDLTVEDIENFNKNTWGWNGCKILYENYKLCLSEGFPPMPAEVSNAVCGPTVPGTKRIDGRALADLNPCPLKACCNVWGQCGLTDDFCLEKESATGAPGTSGLQNGCVSSCGIEIIKASPPEKKIKIAYFEAWNSKRECLTMDIDMIDTDEYTHVHFAFAEVTRDFKVDVSKVQEQFEMFKKMTSVKRIISFGGWDFSTLPGTFNILREAVQASNRDIFKKNVVDFVNEHDLDGVDIDWEYPGAPDIPDIPADDPKNGINYYTFLFFLRMDLDSSKTVSFAAPASYWYLRAYPIQALSNLCDYIVYMTYDLHGQWDYNNKWTSPGCPTGNCLRSHVNDTETMNALAMITKAGAASNKVVVGVASYGRSFKMETAGCTGPGCKFTGSPRVSNAYKGRCTQTGGYISNAEIAEIIAGGRVNKQWQDVGSNIMVFNDTEWVAYMDDDTKEMRSKVYDSYNFAGTTDWAVDLQRFRDGSGLEEGERRIDPDYFSECGGWYTSIQSLKDSKDSMAAHCAEKYVAEVEVAIAEDALKKYDDLVDGGYDKKFEIYEKYVKQQVPDQVNAFMASDKVDKYFEYHPCSSKQGCVSSKYHVESVKCPHIEHEVDMISSINVPNITYSLKDEDGFWEAIGEEYGVQETWVSWGRRHMRTANGCQYAGKDIEQCQDEQDDWWYNYPNGDPKKVEVYNPKTLVGDSHEKAADIVDNLKIIRDFTDYDDVLPWSDAVDAMSLPALALRTAVENMQEISDKADEIEKREREEFILNMIMGILFFIPFVGEAAAAGLTAARSLIRLIGEVGDIALTVYGVVENPNDAFGAIFGYLVGRGGVSNTKLANAAGKRRSIKDGDLKDIKSIKADIDVMQEIRKGVCSL
ncbi:hypothetical protein K4F52_000299 [Lecanicillium sp. MT-2017a]|nr:hypothetical protein K4F52_000299 [Lecanicillium sp. MT-2017a]